MDFCSIHLPDLCVARLYGCLETADDLKAAALVCHAGLTQAQAAAQAAVTRLRTKLEADGPTATVGRRADGTAATWIAELCSWEQTHAAHHVWLDASFCETEPIQQQNGTVAEQVEMVVDRSGNGSHAEVKLEHEDSVGPCLVRQGPNGRPVLAFSDEFGGVPCFLQTPRFAAPLTGPITYLCVARAVGDATLLDSLNEDSLHLELCHGYPQPGIDFADAQGLFATPRACMNCTIEPREWQAEFGLFCGRKIHGRTRSQAAAAWSSDAPFTAHAAAVAAAGGGGEGGSGEGGGGEGVGSGGSGAGGAASGWHVYCAVFDGERSALYVDGVCEARGVMPPEASLDGLTVGIDNERNYQLRGAIAQVRVLAGRLPEAHREALEASLARRYGLAHPALLHDGPPTKRRRVA